MPFGHELAIDRRRDLGAGEAQARRKAHPAFLRAGLGRLTINDNLHRKPPEVRCALFYMVGHQLGERGRNEKSVPVETVYIDMVAFDNNPGQIIRKSGAQAAAELE